jgi:hypothetical protein
VVEVLARSEESDSGSHSIHGPHHDCRPAGDQPSGGEVAAPPPSNATPPQAYWEDNPPPARHSQVPIGALSLSWSSAHAHQHLDFSLDEPVGALDAA